MLEFYTIDLTAIIIIIFMSAFIYKFIEYFDSDKTNDYSLVFISSLMLGIAFSITISYITIEKDVLLTSNYWE
jgi:hypothetical protein